MALSEVGVSLGSKVGFQCFCRKRRLAAGMPFEDLSIGSYNDLFCQYVRRIGKR